jgi:serine/threonine-protein kinase
MIGRMLGGNYIVLAKVGSGGMGAVYRAEQRTLGRTVAVKIIHAHLLHDSGVGLFINEAHAASRINHPNVVGVIDLGTTEEGLPFLVLEYLRGVELKKLVRENGPLSIHRTVGILIQVLNVLAEAHDLGIVHRDLKSANIVLEPARSGQDFVKVVDFGLANVPRAKLGGEPTPACAGRGTPAYMAPEQAAGRSGDVRSDLYSLGVILFEMLTGRLPFESSSSTEMLLLHAQAPVPDVRACASALPVPDAFAEIVYRALAKNPDDRFQTADAFAEALRDAERQTVAEYAQATIPVADRSVVCDRCGEPLSSTQKLCGACGTEMTIVPLAPDTPALGSLGFGAAPPASAARARLHSTGRASVRPFRPNPPGRELAGLQDLRLNHLEGTLAVRIVGQLGTGKSTLLNAFAELAREAGDVVAVVGPDPWQARPAYHGLCHVVRLFSGLGDNLAGVHLPADADAGVQLGLRLMLEPDFDVRETTPERCRRAACEALLWAVRRAAAASFSGRCALVVDDLDAIDAPTRHAIGDALAVDSDACWFVLGSHLPQYEAGWSAVVTNLPGLPIDSAYVVLRTVGAHADGIPGAELGSHVAPLLVEQLVRLHLEGQRIVATSLPDLVAQRLAARGRHARAVAGVMAVLGNNVSFSDLRVLVDDGIDLDGGLNELAIAGLVERNRDGLRWAHPLYREVALGSIPTAERRRLFGVAADLWTQRSAPLEVRALAAAAAGRRLEALLLLDTVAVLAEGRGDAEGGIHALRLAFDTSRVVVLSQDDEALRTTLLFGRRLGEALLASGRLREADLLLREVLELSGPAHPDAVEILGGLAQVAMASDRRHDARAFLDEAWSRARRSGSPDKLSCIEELERRLAG